MLMLWILLLGAALAPDHWPQFRGPDASGVAEDKRLPERWSETENVAWKTAIPGVGWSSPVVWGDRIFVTSVIPMVEQEKPRTGIYLDGRRVKPPPGEHRWMVYCIDFETGKIRWEREVHRSVPKSARHLKNSFASETPVTDGERVYAYFGNVGVFAFDMDGKPLWSEPFGPFESRTGWGTAASPVLHDGRLYIVCDNEEKSFLVAFEAKTGKQAWRVERDEKSSWATPHIWQHDGKTEIVTNASHRIRSYDLDGKLLWELGGASSIAIPTPLSRFGMVYVSSGYVQDEIRPVFAIRPGGTIAWSLPHGGPYNTSPLIYGDYYYTLFDRGFFTAHDARTGKEIYGKVRIHPTSGAFTASPWAYNGKIFALSEDGVTFVIQAGPEYRLLATNPLDEMTLATPAIARGSLFIRTASRLYRIREDKETGK
jgi:outer membrane protein assembly factor BamB